MHPQNYQFNQSFNLNTTLSNHSNQPQLSPTSIVNNHVHPINSNSIHLEIISPTNQTHPNPSTSQSKSKSKPKPQSIPTRFSSQSQFDLLSAQIDIPLDPSGRSISQLLLSASLSSQFELDLSDDDSHSDHSFNSQFHSSTLVDHPEHITPPCKPNLTNPSHSTNSHIPTPSISNSCPIDPELISPRTSSEIDPDHLGLQIQLSSLEPFLDDQHFSLMSPHHSGLLSQLNISINSLTLPSPNEPKSNHPHRITPTLDCICLTPDVHPGSVHLESQSYSTGPSSSSPRGTQSVISSKSNSSFSPKHSSPSSAPPDPSRQQLPTHLPRLCLTPTNNSTNQSPHLITKHASHITRSHMSRTMSLPTCSPTVQIGNQIRHRRQSTPNIHPPPIPQYQPPDRLTDLPDFSSRKQKWRSKPFSSSTVSRPQTTLNSFHPSRFTRSFASLMAANIDHVILVPSNGQRVGVAPIANVSMMPLYLVQPFLSPVSTATPATPFSRLSVHSPHSSVINRSISPITPSTFHALHDHKQLLSNSHFGILLEKMLHLYRELTKMVKCNKILSFTGINSHIEGRTPRPPKNPTVKDNLPLNLARGGVLFSDRYCCFAIPLYNAGIYSIIAHFTVCGLSLGVLSFFAPSILAVAISPGLSVLFGVLCLLVGLFQIVGFYAVYKEKPVIFKKYFIVNSGLLSITLFYSLILLIVSSTKHETAIVQCLVQFVSNDEFLDGPSDTSTQVCSIWTYIQLGVCFFVWILFLFSELYFCYMLKVWGKEQTLDHIKYKSIVSAVRQSMAASSHHAGLLDEENDWESHSRVGSLDSPSEIGSLRGSRYSNNHGRSGSNYLVNGGSRLKNEIEWKESAVAPNGLDDQLSEKEEEFNRKGKLKELEIDEEIIDLGDSSIGNSGSYPLASIPDRQSQDQTLQRNPIDPPRSDQNPFIQSNFEHEKLSSSPAVNTSSKPSHPHHGFDDDQLYYKSPKS